MTNDEFMSWLLKLPQIRMYPYVIRDPAGPRDFHAPVHCFRSDNFREPTLGPKLYGRKASIYKDGEETFVKLEAMTELGGQAVERVFIGNSSMRDYHTDGFRGQKFYRTDGRDRQHHHGPHQCQLPPTWFRFRRGLRLRTSSRFRSLSGMYRRPVSTSTTTTIVSWRKLPSRDGCCAVDLRTACASQQGRPARRSVYKILPRSHAVRDSCLHGSGQGGSAIGTIAGSRALAGASETVSEFRPT